MSAPVAEPAAHVAVRFTVAGVEPVRDRGSLIALAVVVLEVADVPFTLQGVQVHRRAGGGVEVRSPVWRHPRTGAWLPGVLLPPELADALAREVAACLPALAEAA